MLFSNWGRFLPGCSGADFDFEQAANLAFIAGIGKKIKLQTIRPI